MAAVIVIVETAASAHADAFDSFPWSGTIGTLILLVVYALATVGCIMLVFFGTAQVPTWQITTPIAALSYSATAYLNVTPYPTGDAGVAPRGVRRLAGGGGDRGDLRAGHVLAGSARRWSCPRGHCGRPGRQR